MSDTTSPAVSEPKEPGMLEAALFDRADEKLKAAIAEVSETFARELRRLDVSFYKAFFPACKSRYPVADKAEHRNQLMQEDLAMSAVLEKITEFAFESAQSQARNAEVASFMAKVDQVSTLAAEISDLQNS